MDTIITQERQKRISIIFAILAILFALIAIIQFIKVKFAGYEYTILEETNSSVETYQNESLNPGAMNSIDIRTIDFEALQLRNPDVYAWIEVPGTNVDYPILQHETDNSYYLTHTIDHEKTISASIYTENYNAKDFDDLHTVIYGHNMKNGTMFRTLHNFEEADFFNEHKDVIIYLPGETRYYEIFAAYTFDNRHLLFSYDWTDATEHKDYLDEVLSGSGTRFHIDNTRTLTGDDKIITLSTCVNSGDSTKRYLVQAVLVSIAK